jgi:hypothetical protein
MFLAYLSCKIVQGMFYWFQDQDQAAREGKSEHWVALWIFQHTQYGHTHDHRSN